jgi:DNA-binding LytR/AlgR family response regulator
MNILIIEDEQLAYKRLCKMFATISKDELNIQQVDSIATAIEWFNTKTQPDLIFMDIEIADGNSFEIFKHIKIDVPIIFTTAYNQYAIDAFKVNSVDYLLKPIKQNELEIALQKFEKYHTKVIQKLGELFTSPYKQQVVLKLGQKIIPLHIDEIAYIYSRDKMTYYCNTKGQVFPTYTSLDKVQEELDPIIFFRLNRQFIAHKKAIASIKTLDKSKLLINLTPTAIDEIIVSTEKSASFKKWLAS